jgi:RNA polymerase sigma-70 factor (ECF subfamily)
MSLFFWKTRQFHQALEAQWQALYRVAYAWCHDPQLAKDLVQETMTRACHHQHRLMQSETFTPWLFKVMANCWRDHLRRRRDTVMIDSVEIAHDATPESDHETAQLIQRLRHAVAQLNMEQRQVITLIDLQELSYREVADVLDIPIGTVMSRVCRGRQQLKQLLQDLDVARNALPGLRRIK